MNKQLQMMNQPQILSGVALVSTAALSVYSIKSIIDINKKIDELANEVIGLKRFVQDNQRKNNITSANLGRKIEEVSVKFVNVAQAPKRLEPKIVEVSEDEEDDEIDTAVNSFLKN